MATNTELIQELAKRVDVQSATVTHVQAEIELFQDALARKHELLTEEIHQLKTELRVLSDRDARREAELVERKAADEKRRQEIVELERKHAEAQQANAVLRQQFLDHLAQYQEWDKRRWGLIVMVFGAVLSSFVGLVVALAKK
jgi:uncharacterized protein (DUF3084 family)